MKPAPTKPPAAPRSANQQRWSHYEELLADMQKRWNSQRLLKEYLSAALAFPLRLPIKRPVGKILMTEFVAVRHWIDHWQQAVANTPGQLEYETVNNRRIGSQSIPRYLVFESLSQLFVWIGRETEFQQFQQLTSALTRRWPQTHAVLLKSPFRVLAVADQQPCLIAVLEWFIQNPDSTLYLRQLDIPAVDSKFIEQHKGLIHDLLVSVLDERQYRTDITTLSQHGFERKFGLQYDPPLIRFRLLDPDLILSPAMAGLCDISLPLDQFKQLELPLQRVFITENKVNGLAFPPVPGALVIFGMGYGVDTLAQVHWLQQLPVHYWGDIDTHGFNILAQLRKNLPQVSSMLMDEATLLACRLVWGQETNIQRTIDLSLLTAGEAAVLEGLWQQRWQPQLRLEQERIPFRALTGWLENRFEKHCEDEA